MNNKTFYLLLLSFCLLNTSCIHEYTADILDPRISAISSRGKNIAGAYVNGTIWNTEEYCMLNLFGNNCVPEMLIDVDTVNSLTLLSISGGIEIPDEVEDKGLNIFFVLSNSILFDIESILEFNNSEIELDGINNYGGFCGFENESCHNGQGKLFIHGSKVWSPLKGEEVYVLSGTFGFDAPAGCEYSTIYKGRFDFAMSPEDIRISDEFPYPANTCF